MPRNKYLLPDTCAWIDYFRPAMGPLAGKLGEELSKSVVCTCGVVLMEILQGVKTDTEREALADAFEALPWLEPDRVLWAKAGDLARGLREKGITIPFSDIIIATLALEHEATVLTRDRHFLQIKGLQVIGLEPDEGI